MISIIIPVYKVADYLQQCVESVLNQTYKDFEIILVDDGSPDICSTLCDDFAKQNDRIIVIHKKNGGLSETRNIGLQYASAKYVLFVDSDDWLNDKEDLLQLANRAALTEADVISFSYTKIYERTGKFVTCLQQEKPMPKELSDKQDQALYLARKGLYIASACNKLIRLELLRNNDLFFKTGETSEDVVWCLQLLLVARSFDFFNRNIYCYRQRPGSISQTLSLRKCTQLAEQILTCTQLLHDAIDQREPCSYYTAYQLAAFMKVQTFAESYPKLSVDLLKPYAWLLRYHAGNQKIKLLHGMTMIFGFPATCRILYGVYKFRHEWNK